MHVQTTPTRGTGVPSVAGSFTLAVVAVGAVGALAVVAARWTPVSLAVVAALVPLAAAAAVDARRRRLPDPLVAAATLPLLALAAASTLGLTGDGIDPVAPAATGAALLAGPLLALHLVAPAGLGFGDVKAGAAAGAAVGVIQPSLALWVLCVASGAAAAWGLATRRRSVPFGPPLVAAALGVLVAAAAAGVEAAAWR